MTPVDRGDPEPITDRQVVPDWLARRGGWLLLLIGATLIGLASVYANKPTVAPIFAVGGIALAVVGVTLPRMQGQFEFSATGFKLFLLEVGEQTRGLPDVAKAEILDEIVESVGRDAASVSPTEARSFASQLVASARSALALEQAFVRWLAEAGWTVIPAQGPRDFDIEARRNGEVLIAEIKTTVRGAFVGPLVEIARRARSAHGDHARFALVLAEHPPLRAVHELRARNVEVLVQSEDGFE